MFSIVHSSYAYQWLNNEKKTFHFRLFTSSVSFFSMPEQEYVRFHLLNFRLNIILDQYKDFFMLMLKINEKKKKITCMKNLALNLLK